jgi:hypothetical protein
MSKAIAATKRDTQPAIDDLKEGEIGLIAIHDAGARIDVGLGWIGLDQALAETVDRRAGDFVDRGADPAFSWSCSQRAASTTSSG